VVVYIRSLEKATSSVGPFTMWLRFLPLASSALTMLMVLNASLYRSFRPLAGIAYLGMGAGGLFLVFLTGFNGFTWITSVVNGIGDILCGILLLVVKSRWPFKNKR